MFIKHISNYKTTIEVLNKTSKDVIPSIPSSEDWSTYQTELYERSVRIYKDLCREFDKL